MNWLIEKSLQDAIAAKNWCYGIIFMSDQLNYSGNGMEMYAMYTESRRMILQTIRGQSGETRMGLNLVPR